MFFMGKTLCPPSWKWTDRGDVAANDYDQNNLTKDGNYYTIDISGIVGAGRRLVLLRCQMVENAGNKSLTIDTNGQTNHLNASIHRTQFANIAYNCNAWAYTDADGKLEYRFESATWNIIRITVRGWFELA